MPPVKKITLEDVDDSPIITEVNTLIEDAIPPALSATISAVENVLNVPAAFRPVINTRIFAITNLATHEFMPVVDHYIIEIESDILAKVHKSNIRAAIESKFLEATGIRLLNNTLQYIEVTAAKFLPHIGRQ